jgi:hypothetical protein
VGIALNQLQPDKHAVPENEQMKKAGAAMTSRLRPDW